ncbi:hypothetical protein M407DRAFT_29765 [Tulasnella calospora MUT 4182]|uniref:Uncharacterized protein n=1 Tax=Tulasnella calospora MUT 4182 TaxID=1051891 RepID=A0A0C3PYY8_9AGAM|nr:hypothetical protein M407DRAFT_29765 [Tulasnella calospora MUT 4182]
MNGSTTFGNVTAQWSLQVLGQGDKITTSATIQAATAIQSKLPASPRDISDSPSLPLSQRPDASGNHIEKATRNLFTHIIIISLSYAGMTEPRSLQGTKNDFSLLLNHFKYFSQDNTIQFTLLNDFEHVSNDADSDATVPKADTSKAAIEAAIRRAMQHTTPESRALFHFGGDGSSKTGVIAGDGQRISGQELRSWLCSTPYSSVPVTAIFDRCKNKGLLELPYKYQAQSNDRVEIKKFSLKRNKLSNPMLEISATQRQSAFSNRFSGGYHGQLTWWFLRYLEKSAVIWFGDAPTKETDLRTLRSLAYKHR